MPEKSDPKELAALDAVIAASLAGRSLDHLSDDEVLCMSDDFPEITPEGRKILESLGKTPFSQKAPNDNLEESASVREQFAGMYRQGSDESLDPKLKAEIQEKRDEIRARLKAKRKSDV